LEVDEDGLRFDAETVEAERISEDADYEGVRVTFVAYLERANIPIQIDIGFGDVVTPAPSRTDYPTLLEFPGPRLLAYPKETVVAEKLEALVFSFSRPLTGVGHELFQTVSIAICNAGR
jgi:hypothetical protein